MHELNIIESFFLIFTGAALLATFALFTRQPLIIAYIALGTLIGPHGFNFIDDAKLLSEIAEIGIIFLLFLIGLDMQPKSLLNMLRKATVVALGTSLCFLAAGYAVATGFNFTSTEAIIIGVTMMFSSTIIGIKLLPTTVLHHKHTGELVVGLLLLQDLIAILVLLVMGGSRGTQSVGQYILTALYLPLLVVGSYLIVRYVLLRLLQTFDRFHEFIFLLAIGWCLGVAQTAKVLGLSYEIGAFIAGISLATSPISLYIAEHLKPLRDFFLILFFFTLGAGFNISMLGIVALPALILAVLMVVGKPFVFSYFLGFIKEPKSISMEIGVRLGQISEFSLLIAFLATSVSLIGDRASTLIQATAILTFFLNTYWVILKYPSPIAISDRLRRD